MNAGANLDVPARHAQDGLPPIAVTVARAAELCGLSKATLYRSIAAGQLRTRKLGARTLILIVDLHAFLVDLPRGGRS